MKLDWGKGIFIFFVIFIGLATVFLVFSLRQSNDLVTDDYYEQGADYTTQMKTNARSIDFADSIKFGQSTSSIELGLSSYLIMNTDSLKVHFYYPPDESKDLVLKYKEMAQNTSIDKAKLSKGRYVVKISWNMNNEAYYLEKTLFIE